MASNAATADDLDITLRSSLLVYFQADQELTMMMLYRPDQVPGIARSHQSDFG
jgi:hypothetical protein